MASRISVVRNDPFLRHSWISFNYYRTRQFKRSKKRQDDHASEYPPVSILKPLCGLETCLESNLDACFQTKYPKFEIILCLASADDPALKIAKLIRARYPSVDCRIIIGTILYQILHSL
jgi:cellulose synthase/poly-beta-1,6-N-acetylglucosamine synthase-like glycosyltransferase